MMCLGGTNTSANVILFSLLVILVVSSSSEASLKPCCTLVETRQAQSLTSCCYFSLRYIFNLAQADTSSQQTRQQKREETSGLPRSITTFFHYTNTNTLTTSSEIESHGAQESHLHNKRNLQPRTTRATQHPTKANRHLKPCNVNGFRFIFATIPISPPRRACMQLFRS